MEGILEKAAVKRAIESISAQGMKGEVKVLSDSARTALDAANALGIEVGQIASSIVFKLPSSG
ncbi:MAG: YbaK/EbsC family protein, partial [Actinomycetota bacterium]